jgi:Na+-transporting methylmalonyl-CoA/oxaloacetate decarboxylase gamma subunit
VIIGIAVGAFLLLLLLIILILAARRRRKNKKERQEDREAKAAARAAEHPIAYQPTKRVQVSLRSSSSFLSHILQNTVTDEFECVV